MNEDLKQIVSQFNISDQIISIEPYGNGNINNTFVVISEVENGVYKKYLFQKINTNVFKEPFKLMQNIEKVTKFIENKMKRSNDNIHPLLTVILTNNDSCLYEHYNSLGEKDYYRAYNFIEDADVYDRSVDKKVVYNAGKAFGNFQKMLIDYTNNDIEDTIPDFHNTKKRYHAFIKDVKNDVKKRASVVSKEIVFIIQHEDECNLIVDLLDKNIIKNTIIHNDTKVNNVLMNKNMDDFLTVIDLDTVMFGSLLYDYGDGVRSACSTALEDEKDLDNVTIDMDLFKHYTDGYLSEMIEYLSPTEINHLADSVLIMALELGIRFLNDYINGDTYFKIKYPDHNLVRARNQLRLASEIETKLPLMKEYIMECVNKSNNLEKGSSKLKKIKNR